jgi:hypothetical protein
MLIENKKGHYSFLKGISPYSGGVVAAPEFEIEHATLQSSLALRAGFETIEAHLQKAGVPKMSLCAIELRSPKPFSFQGFADFNKGYVEILKKWEILQDGLNPVARTNVAPEVDPPTEPSLHAFSYVVPSRGARKTFVIAGAGELPEGSLDPHDLIRPGETGVEAMAEKATFVLGLMAGRLKGLQCDWSDVSAVDIYTVHDIGPMLRRTILPRVGKAQHQGLTWYFTRPPINGIEFEMDMRGCRREIAL